MSIIEEILVNPSDYQDQYERTENGIGNHYHFFVKSQKGTTFEIGPFNKKEFDIIEIKKIKAGSCSQLYDFILSDKERYGIKDIDDSNIILSFNKNPVNQNDIVPKSRDIPNNDMPLYEFINDDTLVHELNGYTIKIRDKRLDDSIIIGGISKKRKIVKQYRNKKTTNKKYKKCLTRKTRRRKKG